MSEDTPESIDTAAPKAAKKTPAKVKKPPYTVAEKKAISTKRGILEAGDEITTEDISKAALDRFVESGHVIKN